MTLKQIFQLVSIPCVYLHDIKKISWEAFVSMFHLCVCFDLLQFMSLQTFYAAERRVVVYCHAYILRVTNQSWQTGLNESVLNFKVVFVVC